MSAVVARLEWQVPPSALAGKLAAYKERLAAAMLDLATYFAARIEAEAKARAPWTDRTGHARQGLTGRALKTATGVVIVLFHKVAYGIWLEVAQSGRWGIILQTLENTYGDVMMAFGKLVGAK